MDRKFEREHLWKLNCPGSTGSESHVEQSENQRLHV